MGRNLGPLNIKDTYEGLVQISGSLLTDGTGTLIPSLTVTASYATEAESAITALSSQTSVSASHAVKADSALTAVSASYAVTASYAENIGTASTLQKVLDSGNTATGVNIILTGSYQRASGSFNGSVIDNITDTFTGTEAIQHVVSLTQVEYNALTPANNTLYNITDATSLIKNASVVDSTLTFDKDDGTNFTLTIDNVANAVSSSHAIIADSALTSVSASHALNADVAITAGSATTAISASYAVTASYAENSVAPFPFTGSADISGSLNVVGIITGTKDAVINTITIGKGGNNGANNTAVGFNALQDATAGATNNTAVGYQSLKDVTTGDYNTAVGKDAGRKIIGGGENVHLGWAAGNNQTEGASNVFIGATAGQNITNASNNVLIGAGAGNSMVTGSNNTLVGTTIGTNGSANSVLGRAGALATDLSNNIILSDGDGNIAYQYDNATTTTTINGTLKLPGIPDVSASIAAGGGGSATPTGSLMVTGSVTGAILTFTKGDASTFPLTINNVANAVSSSHAINADIAITAGSATTSVSSSHAIIADSALTAVSASYALTASYAENFDVSNLQEVTNAGSVTTNTIEAGGLTAAGLSYPSTDGTNGQVITTDGAGNLSLQDGGGGATPDLQAVLDTGNFATQNLELTGSLLISGSATIHGRIASGNPNNLSSGLFSAAIGGGRGSGNEFNTAEGSESVVIGGHNNKISATATKSVLAGGKDNQVFGDKSGIFAGDFNVVNGDDSATIAGTNNTIQNNRSVIIGGENLTTSRTDEVLLNHLSIFGDTEISSSSLGTGNLVDNLGQDGVASVTAIKHMVNLTQAEYDALTPDVNTFYSIIDSANIVGDLVVSGSLIGEVQTLTIASNIAVMDCSKGNSFVLTLQNGVDTELQQSNIQAGQKISVRINQNASAAGTLSYGSGFIFQFGVQFEPTPTAGAIDLLELTTFDKSTLLGVGFSEFG